MAIDMRNATPEERKAEYKRIAEEIGDDQFFTKKELNHLPEVLGDGENVLAFTSGLMDGNTWLITLTDRRIIFLDKGMIYGLKQATISLDKINSVSGETGIFFGKIKIEDGARERNIDNVWKKSVIKFTNKTRDAIETFRSSRTQSSITPANDSSVDQLERLAGLKEKGVLNSEEFEEQKRKILAG